VLIPLPLNSARAITSAQAAHGQRPQDQKDQEKKKRKPRKRPAPSRSDGLQSSNDRLEVPKGGGDVMPMASVGSDSAAAAYGQVPQVGAAIGGLAGAVWADRNNDGVVDGYVFDGRYYAGAPAATGVTVQNLLTSGPGRAALGAAAGAIAPGVDIVRGATVGAPVSGLAGGVWADRNDDGIVDGYIYEGQYYPGAPGTAPNPTEPAQPRRGERG
jgi:hypothetical protein